MPRVSVVMPAYNHERFVGQAIESVLTQSFVDLELLVNDDASPDNTANVVQAIRDARLVFKRFERNQGASTVVNEALGRARGEYVAILNSDDYFLPGKLEAQVKYLDCHPEVAAVFGLPHFVDETGAPLDPASNPFRNLFISTNMSREQWLRRFFCISNALCHPTVMVRRSCYEAIGGYDARLAQLPDFDAWIEICKRHDIHIINRPLTAFRILAGERNASAGNPTAKARHDWELQYVFRRYLDLSDDALNSIFENEFREIDPLGEKAPRVLLGLLSLKIGRSAWASSSYLAFGLHVLHEELALGSAGINCAEFMRLTGSCDVFNQAAVNGGSSARRLAAEYEALLNSRSWKLTKPLRTASAWVQNVRLQSHALRARLPLGGG